LACAFPASGLPVVATARGTAAYAATVVEAALKKKPARSLWQGHQAWTICMALTFYAKGLLRLLVARAFQLNGLAKFTRDRKQDV